MFFEKYQLAIAWSDASYSQNIEMGILCAYIFSKRLFHLLILIRTDGHIYQKVIAANLPA
jgi:hypothetical protein